MNEHVEQVSSAGEIWRTRPVGSRLVGIVVAREGMPSIHDQREQLTSFGVPIAGFRHPAPNVVETWEERLTRLFGRLDSGDVVVVTATCALGRDAAEEAQTIAELGRRGIIIKVLEHGARGAEKAK
ncbi:recombinase family protein [Microbacterium indicum]|uniref:recombinase family protein n=1 Tax=Microbacterium indicum TaxID=358100 RepID=UPI00042603CC|nr:recombinase family protein [Microbacterium indicum]